MMDAQVKVRPTEKLQGYLYNNETYYTCKPSAQNFVTQNLQIYGSSEEYAH